MHLRHLSFGIFVAFISYVAFASFQTGSALGDGLFRQFLPHVQYNRCITPIHPILPSTTDPYDPSLSNFVGLSTRRIRGEPEPEYLVTLRLDGSPPCAIYEATDDPDGHAGVADVAWSPDSERIYFYEYFNASLRASLLNRDGTGLIRLPIAARPYPLEWSPDSRRFLFKYEHTEGSSWSVFDTLTMTLRPITGAEQGDEVLFAHWSSDSSKIGYVKDTNPDPDETLFHTFATGANGDNLRQLTSGTEQVFFQNWVNHGANFLAVVGGNYSEGGILTLYSADGTMTAAITETPGSRLYSVAADQRRFVYNDGYYLYLYNLSEDRSNRVSQSHCLLREGGTCGVGVSWSASGNTLGISTLYMPPHGFPPEGEFWVVPLTPTPQVPSAPWSNDSVSTVETLLTDEFLVVYPGHTLVNIATREERNLYADPNYEWSPLQWTKLSE